MEFIRPVPSSGIMAAVDVAVNPVSNHPNVYHASSSRTAGVVFISDSLTDLKNISKGGNVKPVPFVMGVHVTEEHLQHSRGIRSPKKYVDRQPDWFATYWGFMPVETEGGLALVSDLIECYLDFTKPKLTSMTRRLAALTLHADEVTLLAYHSAPELINGIKPWRYFR